MKVVLKELLEKKYMHIRQLSFITGISYNNLHKFCNNKTKQASFDNLEKICKALNCNLNDIFEIE